MVWIVINATNISNSLNGLIDRGNFKDAQNIKFYLDNFLKKIKSVCQTHGGNVHLLLYERVILEVSPNVAEQIPNIIDNYMPNLSSKMGIGIGMNFEEANEASQKSLQTKKIELYESNQKPSEYIKSELAKDDEPVKPAVDFPPNVFDPELPDSKNITKLIPTKRPVEDGQYRLNQIRPEEPKLKPDQKEEAQGQKSLIDRTLDELLFPKKEIAQQAQLMQQMAQQQQMMQQQAQAHQEKEQATQHLQNAPQEHAEKEELEDDPVIHYEDPTEKENHQEMQSQETQPEEAQPEEAQPEEDEHDKVSAKLINFLGQLKEQMPELMQLHQSNPEAFKQVMGLVNKMLKLSKTKIKKSELSSAEELEKAIRKRIKQAKGTAYPVGTLKGRKIKVKVGDKTSWRSVASGIVRDNKGTPISVRSSNLEKE